MYYQYNGYGYHNGYGNSNGYEYSSGYGYPNGYGYSCNSGYGGQNPAWIPITPMRKKQFFTLPQYRQSRRKISAGAVTMYLFAAFSLLLYAACFLAESGELWWSAALAVLGAATGAALQITKSGTCAVIVSALYAAALVYFVMFDFIILTVEAMVAAFGGKSSKEMLIILLVQTAMLVLPLAGGLFACSEAFKLEGAYKKRQNFCRRGI